MASYHDNPLLREQVKLNSKPLPSMWLLQPQVTGKDEVRVVIEGVNNPEGEVIPRLVLDAMQFVTDCEYAGTQWFAILLQLMIRNHDLNYVDFVKVKYTETTT